MEYFLGIDIGTTSVKSIAFSRNGKTLNEQSITYPIQRPMPDRSEQDPEEIARAVFKTVENILQELTPDVPRLCCFSSAMHSLIAVDKSGKAISPAIIWADNRASGIAEKIYDENQSFEFYHRTGVPIHAMSPFCKLQWMRDNDKGLFETAYKFIGIKEFIFYKLFGVYAVDASIAAATGLMNMQTRKWDPWILEQIGLPDQKLSEIVDAARNFSSPELFPALKDIPFIIGGSDGAMANVGASDEPDTLVMTVGTSSAARVFVQEPSVDPAMRTFCYYLEEHKWLMGGASNNGGIILQWLREDFFRSNDDLVAFSEQARLVDPGSSGLIFLPYLLGERAPLWNAKAKGILFGLDINHGQPAMIRASMEGIAYCLYGISEPLLEKATIKKIFATGGFARNDIWLQILADTFNLPVSVSETVENSAWGAAKWGMKALRINPIPKTKVSKIFYPDGAAHIIYAKGFQKFQRLYDLLKGEF